MYVYTKILSIQTSNQQKSNQLTTNQPYQPANEPSNQPTKPSTSHCQYRSLTNQTTNRSPGKLGPNRFTKGNERAIIQPAPSPATKVVNIDQG